MSKQSSKSNKKQKRDEISESESDDDLQPIHFFVPGENINAAVLVEYVTQYVDRTAKITSSHHPTVRLMTCTCDHADHAQDKTRTGFNVLAKKTLNAVRTSLECHSLLQHSSHLIGQPARCHQRFERLGSGDTKQYGGTLQKRSRSYIDRRQRNFERIRIDTRSRTRPGGVPVKERRKAAQIARQGRRENHRQSLRATDGKRPAILPISIPAHSLKLEVVTSRVHLGQTMHPIHITLTYTTR